MKTNLAGPVAALALALGVCVAAAPAAAQAQKAVPYADLDLTRAEGVAHLDKRLVRAVKQVCDPGSRDLAVVSAARQCRRRALADARAEASELQAVMVAQRAAAGREVGS